MQINQQSEVEMEYQTLNQLKRSSNKSYGLSYVETLEMAYENCKSSFEFYKKRCVRLQELQKQFRDPERKIVCDVLANGTTRTKIK